MSSSVLVPELAKRVQPPVLEDTSSSSGVFNPQLDPQAKRPSTDLSRPNSAIQRFPVPSPHYEFGSTFTSAQQPPFPLLGYSPAPTAPFRSASDGASFYDYSMRRHSLTGAGGGNSPPRASNISNMNPTNGSNSPGHLKRKSSNEDDGLEDPATYSYIQPNPYLSAHPISLPYSRRRGSSYDTGVSQVRTQENATTGLETKPFISTYLPPTNRQFNGRPSSGPPLHSGFPPQPPPPLIRHQTHDAAINYQGLYRGPPPTEPGQPLPHSEAYTHLPPASAAWARAGPLPISNQLPIPIPGALNPASAYGANPAKETPYSRSPELRISHKLAERKRRKEMAQLFDELRDSLPVDRGLKSSKWEILTKAVEYIGTLKQHQMHLANDSQMLRNHFGLGALQPIPTHTLPTHTLPGRNGGGVNGEGSGGHDGLEDEDD